MELLIFLGTLVTLDVLAMRFGYDSREMHRRERRGLEDELRRWTVL